VHICTQAVAGCCQRRERYFNLQVLLEKIQEGSSEAREHSQKIKENNKQLGQASKTQNTSREQVRCLGPRHTTSATMDQRSHR
jgi:hypothetical protein